MENNTDITQAIIDTINTIFEKLFASIDNNLYSALDKITFINSDILNDNTFILIIANSLLLGFILYYSIKYLLSHITYKQIEQPFSFIIKLIIFGIFMNYSFSILKIILELNSNITLAIQNLGQNIFNSQISFSELINKINTNISIQTSSIDIFSLDGLIKGTLSFSLLSLIFSYSFRYIMVKIFILLSPFAFLSLCLDTTSWFFKSWLKNLFSLLFIQIIVYLVLLLLFSIDFSNSNILNKFIYIGGLYALIKANSFVREFIGGISTNISQTVQSFTAFRS